MLLRLKNRILPLALYEMVLGLRGGAGLTAIVICCGAGLLVGAANGITPSEVSYKVGRLSAIMLGFLALPLVAGAARRDALTLASDPIQSRPQQAHELLLARWFGNYAFLLALLLAMAICAFGAQAILAGPVSDGAGPRISVRAFTDAMLAGAMPLMFLCALAYCAGELLQNVLSAAIIGLYWILVLLGRDYLSRIFDFSLSQNAGAYILLSAGVVLAAMAVARYRQGLAGAKKLNVPILSAACLVAGLITASHFVHTRHDPPLKAHPLAITVASQSIRTNRLPGFWLQDQYDRRIGLHDYERKLLVVGFWSPAVPESVELLATLERTNEKYSERGVQVVGVCLADDWRIGGRFARQRGYSFPVVTDTGTHWAEDIQTASPLAEAYEVSSLPVAFIADGERNVAGRIEGTPQGQWPAIDIKLTEMLSNQ